MVDREFAADNHNQLVPPKAGWLISLVNFYWLPLAKVLVVITTIISCQQIYSISVYSIKCKRINKGINIICMAGNRFLLWSA